MVKLLSLKKSNEIKNFFQNDLVNKLNYVDSSNVPDTERKINSNEKSLTILEQSLMKFKITEDGFVRTD